MKFTQKNKKNKYIIASVVLAVGIATFAIVWGINANDKSSPVQVQSSDSDNEQLNQQDNTDNNLPVGTADDPVRESPDLPVNASAILTIPSYQTNSGAIVLNIAINEVWPNTATCTATLKGPENKTFTESVFAQAQISGCQFNISDLPSGEYEISVYAENENLKTNNETITVKL